MHATSVELLSAAAHGDLNRLHSLLAQGIDVNTTNKANQTALMLAAAFKRAEIVKYLVAAGADVKLRDELGLTAFDWAQQHYVITQLMRAATEPTGSHQVKQTPLTEATHQVRTTNNNVMKAGLSPWDQKFHNSELASTTTPVDSVIAESPSVAIEEPLDEGSGPNPVLTNEKVAPPAGSSQPVRVAEPEGDSELSQTTVGVDSALQHSLPTSPVIRTLFRASIVLLLLVAGFVSYHLATSFLNKSVPSVIQPDPAPILTRPTKSAPSVSAELAGAELFLPDAEYPTDATVGSGKVAVGIQVSKKGIVVTARALNGDESLHRAAETAALGSAFAPERLPDTGALIDGTITYSFLKANDPEVRVQEGGFDSHLNSQANITATAGGPLAGAERKLGIPRIPRSMRVQQGSTTVVVRVSRAGRVMSWRPLDGDTRLRPYVVGAARNSTFDPDKLPGDGQVVGIITYKFQ